MKAVFLSLFLLAAVLTGCATVGHQYGGPDATRAQAAICRPGSSIDNSNGRAIMRVKLLVDQQGELMLTCSGHLLDSDQHFECVDRLYETMFLHYQGVHEREPQRDQFVGYGTLLGTSKGCQGFISESPDPVWVRDCLCVIGSAL